MLRLNLLRCSWHILSQFILSTFDTFFRACHDFEGQLTTEIEFKSNSNDISNVNTERKNWCVITGLNRPPIHIRWKFLEQFLWRQGFHEPYGSWNESNFQRKIGHRISSKLEIKSTIKHIDADNMNCHWLPVQRFPWDKRANIFRLSLMVVSVVEIQPYRFQWLSLPFDISESFLVLFAHAPYLVAMATQVTIIIPLNSDIKFEINLLFLPAHALVLAYVLWAVGHDQRSVHL